MFDASIIILTIAQIFAPLRPGLQDSLACVTKTRFQKYGHGCVGTYNHELNKYMVHKELT